MEKVKGYPAQDPDNRTDLSIDLLNKSESDRKKQLTVRLRPEQYRLVRSIEKNTGISQAEAVRKLVDEGRKVLQ